MRLITRRRKWLFLPSSAQWKGWTLPGKLTAIGAYAGVIGVLATIAVFLWPSANHPIVQINNDGGSPVMNAFGNSNIQNNTYILAATNQASTVTNSTDSRIHNQYRVVIFFDRENSWLPFFGEKASIYRSDYRYIHCNVDEARTHLQATNALASLNRASIGMELLEKGIIQILMDNFSFHWLFNGTDARIQRNEVSRVDDERNLNQFGLGPKLDIAQIKSAFSSNALVKADNILVGEGFFIPPHAAFLVGPGSITISNEFCALSLQYHHSSAGLANVSLFGVNTLSSGETLTLWQSDYVLDIFYSENITSNNHPDLEPYRRWREKIVELLSKWNLNLVKIESDKDMQQRANAKLLGLNPYDPLGTHQQPFNRTGSIGGVFFERTWEIKTGAQPSK